ncbi:sorting nexin-13-like isoform X1 [Styela clava]
MQATQSWSVFWCIIAVILLVTTFGLVGMLCFILTVAVFIGGIVAMFCQQCKHNTEVRLYCMHSELQKHKNREIQKALLKANEWAHFENETRLTGSASIDDSMKECLEYVMRDYVKYWYNDLSDDEEFLQSFEKTLHEVVRIISTRAKNIDWQTYLTTKLVDDFASHVRLYRKAQEKITKLQEVSQAWKQRITAMKGTDSSSESQDSVSISSNTSQQSKQLNNNEPNKTGGQTIIDVFFECEINVEKVCRELVSCDKDKQMDYFQDVSEVVLYLLLPAKELHCRPLKALLKEVLVQGIFTPILQLYSDPDYLNQYMNWLISDNCITSEAFLVVVRHSPVVGELQATRDITDEEIARTRARDDVGDDPDVKQQLSSMEYVRNLCENRINKLQRGEMGYENDIGGIDSLMADKSSNLYNLPLSTTLRNNIALQFFIDFMQTVDGQAYLFFWLTVDGYRASAEQQLNAVKIQQLSGQLKGTPDMEMLRVIGRNIYEQYLSKNASPRVDLDSATDKEILRRLSNEEPSPNVFDELQKKVFQTMQRDEKLYPAFMKSPLYIKLLAELDLLREPSNQSESSVNGSISSASMDDLTTENEESGSKFKAVITQTGICNEHGKSYALFAINVARYWSVANGITKQEKWDTFRRFSEFSDLHQSLKENGSNLGNLRLPSKTIFKDLNEEFLEKRRAELNSYLKSVLSMEHPPRAMESIHTFLDAKAYQKNNRTLKKKVDSVMRNSVRSVTNFVMQAPDNLLDGIHKASDKVSGGIHRISIRKNGTDTHINDDGLLFDDCRVSEQIEANIEGNIPLRIVLLLMDEVFDLKHRNQWLRRQIVAALQQLVRAVFGDRMNRKIIEYVDNAVAPEQVVDYICKFRDSFWPGGILAEKAPERDMAVRMRTRVLTKSKLLGAIPDELRPLVGTETSRRGMMRVFELFQHPELNTRLFIVLMEGVMQRLFPSNRFKELFEKFHSNSPKMRARKRERMSRRPLIKGNGTKRTVRSRR